ncbi:MAG: glycosyltransferase [Pseudomonadota bacterium]|nr:glycosyltransferase [Pseudomonadota bacterium]
MSRLTETIKFTAPGEYIISGPGAPLEVPARAADKPITVIAPTIYPLGKQGYAGIERLVSLFLKGLLANGVTNLACVCTTPSILPRGVQRIDSGQPVHDFTEPWLGPTVACLGESASCFLDFSHSKFIGRAGPDLPHISPIWHDPYIMQPSAPRQNVICLSNWQLDRFREVYKQDAKVLDPHAGDGDYFVPGLEADRGDYLVYLGKLHPTKGAGLAIDACKKLQQRLIIIGTATPGDPPEYQEAVKAACDGVDIVFHGPAIGDEKLRLYQNAKALFYPVNYEPGTGEAHSHKSIEPPLCGTPVILYDQGAMREVFDDGVTGQVISGEAELAEALKWAETLDRGACRQRALERWDYRAVVKRWLPVIERVAKGERWP